MILININKQIDLNQLAEGSRENALLSFLQVQFGEPVSPAQG